MKTTLRAVIALALLAGYYLLTLAVLAVAALAGYLMIVHPGLVTVEIGVTMLLLSVPVLGGLVQAAWRRPGPPGGLPVERAAEPALWAQLDELAARIGTRPPDEVRLTPDANAAVGEETRWFGLSSRRRHMVIGMPLLETLTVAQLRAVLGHELGHYSGRHTRLGGITYRGAVALGRTVVALDGGGLSLTVLQKIFGGYARLYFLVSQAVRRAQEIEADRFMVEISGRRAAADALRSVRTTTAAWMFLLGRLGLPAATYGLAPADLFGGFRALLAEPSRQGEIRKALAETEQHNPYDSHPTFAERLTAVESCPEPAGLVPDERPATALLADPAAVRELLRTVMFGPDATVLSWGELVARIERMATAEAGLALLTVTEHVTGTSPANLGTVLGEIEQGRAPALALQVSGGSMTRPQRERIQILAYNVRALVSSALQATGNVTVRFSWAGKPVSLAGPDGAEVDIEAAVPADLASHHVPALRDWLASWGADPEYRPEPPPPRRPV